MGVRFSLSVMSLLSSYSNVGLIDLLMISSIASLCFLLFLYLAQKRVAALLSKIKKFLEKFTEKVLFKVPDFERFYMQGYFFFYWTICWLCCRFTIISPLYSVLITDDSVIFTRVVLHLVTILTAMLVALIPTILLTRSEYVNSIITKAHYYLCTEDPYFLKLVLRAHVIRCIIYNDRAKKLICFLLVSNVFVMYILTGNIMLLELFLFVMYLKLYSQRVVSKIIPNIDKIESWYTIPFRYFLASYKYRYWGNKLPEKVFFRDIKDPSYFFGVVDYNTYMDLETIYLETLFTEMLADKSIHPHKKLEYYHQCVEPSPDSDSKDQWLVFIEQEIAALKKPKMPKKKGLNMQKRSYHSTRNVTMLGGDNDWIKDLLDSAPESSTGSSSSSEDNGTTTTTTTTTTTEKTTTVVEEVQNSKMFRENNTLLVPDTSVDGTRTWKQHNGVVSDGGGTRTTTSTSTTETVVVKQIKEAGLKAAQKSKGKGTVLAAATVTTVVAADGAYRHFTDPAGLPVAVSKSVNEFSTSAAGRAAGRDVYNEYAGNDAAKIVRNMADSPKNTANSPKTPPASSSFFSKFW